MPTVPPLSVIGYQVPPNGTRINGDYTLQQGDNVITALAALTVTLTAAGPLPLTIVADGGDVVLTGPLHGGDMTIPQGSLQTLSYSADSGEWSCTGSLVTQPWRQVGGVGGTIEPVDPTASVQAGGGGAATGDNFAFGNGSNAAGGQAVAMGYQAQATGQGAIALGYLASAVGIGAFAGGAGQALGTTSCAFGESEADGLDSAAFGKSHAVNTYDFAACGGSHATGGSSAAFNGSTSNDPSDFACALGTAGNGSSPGSNFAANQSSSATGGNSSALAGGSATLSNDVAIGSGAVATGPNALALGLNASATAPGYTAIGGTQVYVADAGGDYVFLQANSAHIADSLGDYLTLQTNSAILADSAGDSLGLAAGVATITAPSVALQNTRARLLRDGSCNTAGRRAGHGRSGLHRDGADDAERGLPGTPGLRTADVKDVLVERIHP